MVYVGTSSGRVFAHLVGEQVNSKECGEIVPPLRQRQSQLQPPRRNHAPTRLRPLPACNILGQNPLRRVSFVSVFGMPNSEKTMPDRRVPEQRPEETRVKCNHILHRPRRPLPPVELHFHVGIGKRLRRHRHHEHSRPRRGERCRCPDQHRAPRSGRGAEHRDRAHLKGFGSTPFKMLSLRYFLGCRTPRDTADDQRKATQLTRFHTLQVNNAWIWRRRGLCQCSPDSSYLTVAGSDSITYATPYEPGGDRELDSKAPVARSTKSNRSKKIPPKGGSAIWQSS